MKLFAYLCCLLSVSCFAVEECELTTDKIMQDLTTCFDNNPTLTLVDFENFINLNVQQIRDFICNSQTDILDVFRCMKEKVIECLPENQARILETVLPPNTFLEDGIERICDNSELIFIAIQNTIDVDCLTTQIDQFLLCSSVHVSQLSASGLTNARDVSDVFCSYKSEIAGVTACIEQLALSCIPEAQILVDLGLLPVEFILEDGFQLFCDNRNVITSIIDVDVVCIVNQLPPLIECSQAHVGLVTAFVNGATPEQVLCSHGSDIAGLIGCFEQTIIDCVLRQADTLKIILPPVNTIQGGLQLFCDNINEIFSTIESAIDISCFGNQLDPLWQCAKRKVSRRFVSGLARGLVKPEKAKRVLCRYKSDFAGLIECLEHKVINCVPEPIRNLKSALPRKGNLVAGFRKICSIRNLADMACFADQLLPIVQCSQGEVSQLSTSGLTNARGAKRFLCSVIRAEKQCIVDNRGTCRNNVVNKVKQVLNAIFPFNRCNNGRRRGGRPGWRNGRPYGRPNGRPNRRPNRRRGRY